VDVVPVCGWDDVDLVITQRRSTEFTSKPNNRLQPTGVPPDLAANVQDASG